AAQTSLSLLPYYVEVTPQKSSTGLYDVIVPLPVLDKSSADLADLRLFDAANREIPYAVRVRQELDEQAEIDARLFNYAVAGSTSEVSVDLGKDRGEHNERETDTTGGTFRRQVKSEGTASGSQWRILKDKGVVFNSASDKSTAESKRVDYPASRYRYLRVR